MIPQRACALSEGHEPKEDCGTHLLKKISPSNDGDKDHDHKTYEDYEKVKTVEYIPNRLIGWEVVAESWHSYHQLYDGDRKSLKFFVQEKLGDYEHLQRKREKSKQSSQDWRGTVSAARAGKVVVP